MRVAFQVEGKTDLAIYRRLVELILNSPVEEQVYLNRSGGLHEVFRTLKQSAWQAWQTGCMGMVVSVDSDDKTPHDSHGDGTSGDCRHCAIVNRLPALPERPLLPRFSFVVAVPVQAIEAWMLQLARPAGIANKAPLHSLDRHTAKRFLWGAVTPTPTQIRSVLDAILPSLTAMDLQRLDHEQPSFAGFLESVTRWGVD